MPPPTIELTDPVAICKELFDDDRWIKDEFAERFSVEALKLSEALAVAFRFFPRLDALSRDGDEHAAFVSGFVFGIFDDLVVSSKLLISGKMIASGNLMRQAIEGVAVSILCASQVPVFVQHGKGRARVSVPVTYWRKVRDRAPIVHSHRSLDHLELNADELGVSRAAIKRLKDARHFYHQFSHPSQLGMASRMSMGEAGSIFIGGNFDEAKLKAYRVEFAERTGLCSILPEMIQALLRMLAAA